MTPAPEAAPHTPTSSEHQVGQRQAALGPVALRRWTVGVFAFGLAIQLWLWWRGVWIYSDQAALYSQALDWLQTKSLSDLSDLGKPMSAGVRGPAAWLRLLVGLPLMVWESARASSLVVVLFHAVAGVVLARTMRRLVDPSFTLAFLTIYWLAPWRLYHGGFVWEPNYLFLPAALHLWACSRLAPGPADRFPAQPDAGPDGQRTRSQLAISLVLGLVIATAPQLHPSGVVLLVLTVLLWLRRQIAPSVLGLGAGLALGSASALPALTSVVRGLDSGAAGETLVRSQLEWLPLSGTIKALTYWLRLPSADIGRRLTETTFCGTAQTDFGLFGGGLPCGYLWLLIAAANVSILVCVIANVRYLRGYLRGASGKALAESLEPSLRPGERFGEGARWLSGYVAMALAALLLTVFFTPMRLQGWYTIVILHAACVPVAAWFSEALVLRRGRALRSVLLSFVVLRLLVIVTLGFAHPMFVAPENPALLYEMLPSGLRFLVPGSGPN